MSERLRLAARWVVVAALAILALLGPRRASGPAPAPSPEPAIQRPAVSVTVTTVEQAPEPVVTGDGTAAALEALASGATCADRLAAVDRLRALRDPAAIPALTAASRGDRCVAPAARAAVRALGHADAARW
jgi:hypothetical protein